MALDEFNFIHQYFANLNPDLKARAAAKGVELGIGDDAAMVKVERSMAVTTDTMIEGVHFFSDMNPHILGARSLEVNFSDVYAMGAMPQFVTLSLIIPKRYRENDSFWQAYSNGFAQCLRRHDATLIGGNISSTSAENAPLTIVVTAFGQKCENGKVLRRDMAKAQDALYVTGVTGFNGLYVKAKYSKRIEKLSAKEAKAFEEQAHFYDARMAQFIEILSKYSTCAVDVSDGLLGDLSHILVNSKCRALVNAQSLPLCSRMHDFAHKMDISSDDLTKLALSAGGDYNILYTISKEQEQEFLNELAANDCIKGFINTKIGTITSAQPSDFTDDNALATNGSLITLVDNDGNISKFNDIEPSFNHFVSDTAADFAQ